MRYEPYGARYTRYSARCHSVISLMVWTTTSTSHSFPHSGLWSSAPVAAGAASPPSCGLGSPSGVAPCGASFYFGAAPSPSCGAAAGASSSCGGAGASSSCAAAAAGVVASSSCAAAAGAPPGAAASAGPLSSCGGAGGWAGGSPWGFFFFGVGGLDGDILMVFGSGQRSTISSASYVSHHDYHLSNSSYTLLLAGNTWQLGVNSDQSSSSSSSSPCWLGLH